MRREQRLAAKDEEGSCARRIFNAIPSLFTLQSQNSFRISSLSLPAKMKKTKCIRVRTSQSILSSQLTSICLSYKLDFHLS